MKELADYMNLENQIRELKAKQEAIRTQILEGMIEKHRDTVTTAFGTFSIVTRKNYEFDADAKNKIGILKKKVKEEEKNMVTLGHAKLTETQSLRFLPNKPKE